jgi:hypothetical protein
MPFLDYDAALGQQYTFYFIIIVCLILIFPKTKVSKP